MNEIGRTILVAQDGSPAAQVAAQIAIQIARSQRMSIHGLYVVDVNLAMDPYADHQAELGHYGEHASGSTLVERFEAWGGAALTWLEERCEEAGVRVSVEVEAGGVPQLILKRAEQAGLLSLGRRGRGHPDAYDHLGGNFRAIAHRAPSPVLAGGDVEAELKHVLLGYHGGEHAQDALAWTSLLQRTVPATVDVISVFEGQNQHEAADWFEHVEAVLEQSNLADYQFLCRSGEPASEISAAANQAGADLIIIGGHRHKGLVEWLVGSTMDRVLRENGLPVLIV
jgi:nucleotide-binding universal stress UspA family protein